MFIQFAPADVINNLISLLEKNNYEIKKIVKDHQFLNENIYRIYFDKYKIKTLPFDTILLSLFNCGLIIKFIIYGLIL